MGIAPVLSYGEVCESKSGQFLFLATNLPFFACGLSLAARGYALLGVVTAIAGFVSGAFHFYQCIDGQGSERVRLLLIGDLVAAATLGIVNIATASTLPSPEVLLLGAGGFGLLYVGTLRTIPQDVGNYLDAIARHHSFYTITHGLWHLLICSASSLFVVQSHRAHQDAPQSEETELALSAAAALSTSGTALFVLRGCPCGCSSRNGVGIEADASGRDAMVSGRALDAKLLATVASTP